MLGNVFSPYYARARSRGGADPLAHCTMNVALYGRRHKRWALTEVGASRVQRSCTSLRIARSQLSHDPDGSLFVQLDEATSPFGRRLQGTVRIRPSAWSHTVFALDEAARHHWAPLALRARADVDLRTPERESWSGHAYVDTNGGAEPLEDGFRRWDWSRTAGGPDTQVIYDVVRRDGSRRRIARMFDERGTASPLDGIASHDLAQTTWGVERVVCTDADRPGPRAVRALEDTPFYARTLMNGSFSGAARTFVHETVDLDRFRKPWVQFLLPFKMRREPS